MPKSFATELTGWLTGVTSKNILCYLSNKSIERYGSKRLKYWRRRTGERVFFPLKVLMCHVLFKPPSAGTPIYTFPWGPIPLRLPSSTQPASRSSITHSSIHPSFPPPSSIHSSMADGGGAEGTKLARRERDRGDDSGGQRRKKKGGLEEERLKEERREEE